jgi:hypothetical protein
MNANELATADALYVERVKRARPMTGEERMLEGVRMFDRECAAKRLQIMQANPTFTEADAQAEVSRQLREARLQEEAELRQLMATFPPR